MIKLSRKIIAQVFIYVLFVIVLNILGAIFIMNYVIKRSFFETVILLFCNNSIIIEKSSNELYVSIVIAVKQIIEGVLFAILGSVIFSYILNRDVRIIFPKKIAIRRRTSEGTRGKLTAGILLGNPGKNWIYDVQCKVYCSYIKSTGEITQRNSEVVLKSTVDLIQNYYRFSFEITDFPRTFWEHYLNKSEAYIEKDYLYIIIVGTRNGIGGKFKCEHKYLLQDIVIDLHDPEKHFKKTVKNIFTQKEKEIIDWKEFSKYIEAGEKDRLRVIEEIERYCLK